MEQREPINCNVVRDLLPLYADDVLSADSAALVDAHLPHCPPCAAELTALRAPVPAEQKSARSSLKATRRRLGAILAAAALLVTSLLLLGFRLVPRNENDRPVAYYDGLFEPLLAFHGTADDPTGEGDFLKVQLKRQPRFEYGGGGGQIQAEDVVTIDGARVGVAYIQVMQDPLVAARSTRKANKQGENPMIVSYGWSTIRLAPQSEAEKARVRDLETPYEPEGFVYDEANFASRARDIPITRVYYYNGPTKNLVNEALGWSERGGVFADSLLIWDAANGEVSASYRDANPQVALTEVDASNVTQRG